MCLRIPVDDFSFRFLADVLCLENTQTLDLLPAFTRAPQNVYRRVTGLLANDVLARDHLSRTY